MIIAAYGGMVAAGVRTASAQTQGQWTVTGAMLSARESGAQVRLSTGKVLAAGGYDANGNILAAAEIYNPAKGGWTATASMALARENFPAVALSNGKILVVGGYGAGGAALAAAELFDSKTNSWSAAGSLSVPRYAETATLLASGKVLVAGGCTDSGCSAPTAVSELYNPATNSWAVSGTMTLARGYHSAVRLASGQVLAIGGYAASGPTAATELYTPATGAWAPAASTSVARYQSGTTLLQDGKVLVSGGVITKYPMNSAELYDPAANAWSPTGPMTAGRYAHTSTLLPDGTVLLAGGQSQSISCGKACTGYIPTASTEIYTEATNGFSATSPMARALAYHTTTLVGSGQALTAGGSGYNAYCCQVVSDAEYYTPLSLSFSAVSLNFGFLQIGLTSPMQTITVNNVSSHAVAFTGIAATGDYAQSNTCPASLGAGQNCTISISFAPLQAGIRTGAVTLTDNSPGSPKQTIALTGTGEALALGFSPGSINFGSVAVGSSLPVSATLINDGAAAVTITGVSVTPGGKTYTQTNTCPAVLGAQQSCSFTVLFTPPDVAAYKATLAVSNSAGAAASLPLTGIGVDGGG
jgi:hypothetical protein